MKLLFKKCLSLTWLLSAVLISSCGVVNTQSVNLQLGGGDGHGFEINRFKSLKCLGEDITVTVAQGTNSQNYLATLVNPSRLGAESAIPSLVARKLISDFTIFERPDFTLSVRSLSKTSRWDGSVKVGSDVVEVICAEISVSSQ